jgi:hypothetical protein
MNERIKELLAQTETDISGKWISIDEAVRFAQLIVQECAEICEEMAAKCAGLPGNGALAKDCAYWIKKDFGVEE